MRIYFLLLCFLLAACQETHDFDRLARPHWQPELAVPLVQSQLSMEDLLNQAGDQDLLEVDQDKMISLVYASQLFSLKGNELLNLPDVQALLTDSLQAIKFPFADDQQIHLLELISGQLQYQLPPADSQDVAIDLHFPFIFDENGQPLDLSLLLQAGMSADSTSGTIDLSGFQIDFTGYEAEANTLLAEYLAYLAADSSLLNPDFPLQLTFEELVFRYAEGYLGQLDFDLPSDTLHLKLFKQWLDGTVYIENPQIQLQIDNSFGLPITASFSTFEAWSDTEGGQVIALASGSSLADGFVVDYPNLQEVGQFLRSSFTLTPENSNVRNFLAISPKEVRFGLHFQANHELRSQQLNFITDDSQLSADMELRMPMQGRIENMRLQDTIALAQETVSILEQLHKASFKLQTENRLPLDLSLQLYFTDAAFQPLDSLLLGQEMILKAGTPDAQGRVHEAGSKTTFIDFSANRSTGLQQAKYIILKALLNTPNEGSTTVKLYADYSLALQLGLMAIPQ